MDGEETVWPVLGGCNFSDKGALLTTKGQTMELIMEIISLIVVGIIVASMILIVVATIHVMRDERKKAEQSADAFFRRDGFLNRGQPSNDKSWWKTGVMASTLYQGSRDGR